MTQMRFKNGSVKHTEVGAASGQDGVDVVRGRNVAASERWNPSLIPDSITRRNAEQAAVIGPTFPDGLAHHGMDQIGAVRLQKPRDLDRFVQLDAAEDPIARRDSEHQRPWIRASDCVNYLQWKTHPVFQDAPVLIATVVRQRRDKACEQIAMR